MKDKAGRTLEAGDIIVYGHALGRCAALQYGKVLELKNGKLKVQGVNEDWTGRTGLLRPGHLYFGDRTLILERVQVPKGVLKLLDSVVTS